MQAHTYSCNSWSRIIAAHLNSMIWEFRYLPWNYLFTYLQHLYTVYLCFSTSSSWQLPLAMSITICIEGCAVNVNVFYPRKCLWNVLSIVNKTTLWVQYTRLYQKLSRCFSTVNQFSVMTAGCWLSLPPLSLWCARACKLVNVESSVLVVYSFCSFIGFRLRHILVYLRTV